MNLGSKGKKRMVLPTRPDPPSVEQIIDDINRAYPNDPVFSILQEQSTEDVRSGSTISDVEVRYLQSRRFLELNERLQEARSDLVRRREELRVVGESLEQSVTEVKDRAI
uniref:Si:ch73-238c9.1 n=1 Tax=Astyanax mexicanus TaxID=7994 RepID=A0A3B1JE44_ASTMX